MVKLELGDTVILKKPHPCGSARFSVVRVGADYKLKCLGCGHVVMLDSTKAEKRIKHIDTAAASEENTH